MAAYDRLKDRPVEPVHWTKSALGCWCGPYRDPIDPEVIIHRRPVVS